MSEVKPMINILFAQENKLYAAGGDGYVSLLNSKTGNVIWHDRLAASLVTPPLMLNNKIYFSSGLGNLYGYHLASNN